MCELVPGQQSPRFRDQRRAPTLRGLLPRGHGQRPAHTRPLRGPRRLRDRAHRRWFGAGHCLGTHGAETSGQLPVNRANRHIFGPLRPILVVDAVRLDSRTSGGIPLVLPVPAQRAGRRRHADRGMVLGPDTTFSLPLLTARISSGKDRSNVHARIVYNCLIL